MFGRGKNASVVKAQKLKEEGDLDKAVAVLRQDGMVDEAANWLAEAKRYREAARLLLEGIDTRPQSVPDLAAGKRRRILMAAIYFVRGREPALALPLFEALGETQRAAQVRESMGADAAAAPVRGVLNAQEAASVGDLETALEHYKHNRDYKRAGKTARSLGRLAEAADLFSAGEHYFEAAACYMELEDYEGCLDALVHIPPEDDRYRSACMQAIRVAQQFGDITFRFDQFMGPFIDSGPSDELEAEAFGELARLYNMIQMFENAIEAAEKALAVSPKNGTATLALQAARAHQEVTTGPIDESRPEQAAAPLSRFFTPVEIEEERAPPVAAPPPSAAGPMPRAAEALSADFSIGTLVEKRYQIQEIIGRGANAIVLRAHDQYADDDVALKVMTDILPDEGADARFDREVRVATAINHPNVVRVYNVGSFGARRYLVMQLLVGSTLADRLIASKVTVSEALDWTLQACQGLHAAHSLGVIHRDIKPANLFITTDNLVKVMDFGLARLLDASLSLTGGQITGTPRYMSPEQINQGPITPATDLYALGVVLYELLTGQPPFVADELVQVLMMHTSVAAQSPRALNSEIPENLERIVLRLLAKEPANRYGNAVELATELQSVQAQVR